MYIDIINTCRIKMAWKSELLWLKCLRQLRYSITNLEAEEKILVFSPSQCGTCPISGVFCRIKLLSRYRRTLATQTYANYCLARRQPIRPVVYPRVFNRQRRPAAIVCRGQNALAGDYIVIGLLCRRRHHASEVQHLFSTRSLSEVSWGKVSAS
jgi:hypothetical protein